VAWVRNLIGNVESAQQGLVQSGLCSEPDIEKAIMELIALCENDQGSALFAWNRAAGVA
jgi:hypothetical protein